MSAQYIVVDIGGTNSRVALCQGAHVKRDSIRRYRNADYPSGLEPVLDDYLTHYPEPVAAICIDLAGPVQEGIGRLTNLDWVIDAKTLAARYGAQRVELLNDMQAQGHALPYLEESSLTPLLEGAQTSGDQRLVINIGTGLNAAPVLQSQGRSIVPASEAGHLSLTAVNEEELRLLDWLARTHPAPGIEDVLSGRGLERLYGFALHEAGGGAALKAAQILKALENAEPQALRAGRLFAGFFGRYASDLALASLPHAGIYLVGGVVRHLGPHLMELGFAASFYNKGRFSDLVRQFPVSIVTDDYAALAGCAGHLAEICFTEGLTLPRMHPAAHNQEL